MIVETSGLRKVYGSTTVLDGIDLGVREGEVLALLGPNGAGKTTTIRVLSTLTKPDGGSARVAGHDVVREATQVRAAISLTGQYAAVDAEQTGRENLVMAARLMHLGRRGSARRADELLERFELVDAGGQAGADVLRRDAAAPRPRDEPGRGPERDLPRRADHRARPGQPHDDVGRDHGAGARRHDDPADHAVPGGGRPAR